MHLYNLRIIENVNEMQIRYKTLNFKKLQGLFIFDHTVNEDNTCTALMFD